MADVPLMNNPMTTAGDVIQGGASGAPARLALGTAGQVLKVNAGATAVEWAAESGGGGGNPVVYDIERYTAGDLSITSTTQGDAIPSVGSAVVAATTGDLLMIGLSLRSEGTVGIATRFDAKFITGATENFVSSLGTTSSGQGVSGWLMPQISGTGAGGVVSGEVAYVVQAADISGGNVTVSLRCWKGGAGTVNIAADADAPLLFWVRNLGQ